MARTTNRPKWLTADEKSAWKNLSLMNLQLLALLGRELTGDGISYQDYMVLAELSDRPDGTARVTELGRCLGWEKSRVSHHISRMENRGLVERRRCETDQRGWLVEATAAGLAAIESAAPGHVAVVREHFIDLLTPAQLRVLDEVATTVLAHLPTDD